MTKPDAQTRAQLMVMLRRMYREEAATRDAFEAEGRQREAEAPARVAQILDAVCARVAAWDVPDSSDAEVQVYANMFGGES